MAPMEAMWKMLLSSPISVQPSITVCGPTLVPLPMVTCSPITTYGPISTPSAILAPGWIIAVLWIIVFSECYLSARVAFSSASVIRVSPTYALAATLQMPRLLKSVSITMRRVSPGFTGFLKRALSIAMK